MYKQFEPYIPKNIDEIIDRLGWMTLKAPTFRDSFFTDRNVETIFFELNEALRRNKRKFGDENFARLMDLSDRMRAHFEADPEKRNGETQKGRLLIYEMEDLLIDENDRLSSDPRADGGVAE
jgi:hypothetical protein